MRQIHDITDIIIHGAWTPPDLDIGADEIDMWHRQRGFDEIGYHYVIRRDGTREAGRHWQRVGAGVKGQNAQSLHICLVGGKDADIVAANSPIQDVAWEFNYTAEQMAQLGVLIADLVMDFPIERIRGHRDYPDVTKRCPGFDVRAYFDTTSRMYGLEV